jgi:hypothetical protein
MGEEVVYNIFHFIAYYPALSQLGFIFSSNLVSRNFKGLRCFGGLFELGAQGRVPLPLWSSYTYNKKLHPFLRALLVAAVDYTIYLKGCGLFTD